MSNMGYSMQIIIKWVVLVKYLKAHHSRKTTPNVYESCHVPILKLFYSLLNLYKYLSHEKFNQTYLSRFC